MKTDELISILANNVQPVNANALPRRYAIALGMGIAASMAIMLSMLGLRPDLSSAAHLPIFWIKLGLPASLAIAGTFATLRLSRPGAQLGAVPLGIAAPIVLLWAHAAISLVAAGTEERSIQIYGASWTVCSLYIASLSIPSFVAALWAMRGCAPTHLRLAGGAAGLLAGASGAFVYALHCPEMSTPFLAIWYVTGIAIPSAVGAIIAPSLLRW